MRVSLASLSIYTCKYNEGWDLWDIILVTDIRVPHTQIRISNKGVQAIGRSRNPPHQIYHITNHRNTNKMKTQAQITTDYQIHVDAYIQAYNHTIEQGAEPMLEFRRIVEKFADVNEYMAIYNTNKFDQMVNDQLTHEEYADMEAIGKQWEAGLYQAHHLKYEERLAKESTQEKRKSKADKLKATIEEIERLELEKKTFACNWVYNDLNDLKAINPFAWQAYRELAKAALIKLGYKETAIKTALIEQSNVTAEMKLKNLLPLAFQVTERYTKNEIKHTMQRLYNTVCLKDKYGNIKTAPPSN